MQRSIGRSSDMPADVYRHIGVTWRFFALLYCRLNARPKRNSLVGRLWAMAPRQRCRVAARRNCDVRDDDRGQPAQTGLACRDRQAVARVAGGGGRGGGGGGGRHPGGGGGG